MRQLHDVAVVGAGLLGLAAGRALTARGHDVVVLEQAGAAGHDQAGSKGSCRIFRLGYQQPDYVRAARQAGKLWRDLEAAAGRQVLLPHPQLTVGAGVTAVREAMQAAGAACELLPAAEVAERFPSFSTDGPALLEPDSAVIRADVALAVLAADAGEIRYGVRVTGIADDGRAVKLATSEGPVTAHTAVVTAGPWSAGLLATAGLAVPGRATLEQVCYLQPRESAASPPIFIAHGGGEEPYGLPVPFSPLYKIGIHHGGPAVDPDAQHDSPDPALAARTTTLAARYLPGHDLQPALTERCVYDNTPDEDFVIDRTGNVVVGSGTSGHGFKFGPLFGQWLAALADGGPGGPDPALRERFTLRRFGGMAPVTSGA